jgi:tRNA pseudouridine55 synthase
MIGFIFIDKAKGETSFNGVAVLRKLFDTRRIGFVGTLDPLATGLMIYAIGDATKLIAYLDKADKVYETTVRFGGVSSTYDAAGTIEVNAGCPEATRRQIEKLLEDYFTGEIDQTPPIFSAIKINGKPAYAYARKGKEVVLKSRKTKIFEIEILTYSWPLLRLRIHCSSGTYIRSIAHDLGKMLGCGGYVEELRRVKIGHYNVKNAVMMDTLNPGNALRFLLRPEEFFDDYARIELNRGEFENLSNGHFIHKEVGDLKGPILAMFEGRCVGVVRATPGFLKFEKQLVQQ